MKDDRPETSWKFSGKKEHFERFDKMVLRNARLKLGGKLGPQFWNGTLPTMEDMSEEQWAEYTADVWDVIEENNITRAKWIKSTKGKASSGFNELPFHVKWRKRQYELLFDYVEANVVGEAEQELATYSRDKPHEVRKKLLRQFGVGSDSCAGITLCGRDARSW